MLLVSATKECVHLYLLYLHMEPILMLHRRTLLPSLNLVRMVIGKEVPTPRREKHELAAQNAWAASLAVSFWYLILLTLARTEEQTQVRQPLEVEQAKC